MAIINSMRSLIQHRHGPKITHLRWLLAIIGMMVFFAASQLLFPAKPVAAQDELLGEFFTILTPADGYRINEPIEATITYQCGETDCPNKFIFALSDSLRFIDSEVDDLPAKTEFDFEKQRLTVTAESAREEISVKLNLIVAEPALQQPFLDLGIMRGESVTWVDTVPIFPIRQKTRDSQSVGKSPVDPDLFMRTDLEFGLPDQLDLTIATANQRTESLESVEITTILPEGMFPTSFDSGWFTQANLADERPTVKVSYRMTETWFVWSEYEAPIQAAQKTILNPLLTEADEATEDEVAFDPFSAPPITAIKFEYDQLPAGFRWGAGRLSESKISLAISPTLKADWIELCTEATVQSDNNSEQKRFETCTASRPTKQTETVQSFDFWVTTDLENDAPAPGETIELKPELISSASKGSELDLIVELPRWLTYSGVQNKLATTISPTQAGEEADNPPETINPSFDESIAIESGSKMLHWSWAGDLPLNEITLPIIEVNVESGVPSGAQTFPMYLLSDGLTNCWGERPFSRDFLDLDRDNNAEELMCKIDVAVGIRPITGIAANIRTSSSAYPGVPFSADFDVINGGNQPLTEIKTAVRFPKGWLTAPPAVPQGLAIAYSTSNRLCAGSPDCNTAGWQPEPPNPINNTTAIKLYGSVFPIDSGDRLTTRFFLQAPADLDPEASIELNTILLNGVSESGETVEFRYQPDPITFGDQPAGVTGGVVFYDSNQNGILDDGEEPVSNYQIALISPGGDNAPATADDRLVGWATSNSEGAYQFSNGLAGVYYLATQSFNGLIPTDYSGDPESETSPFTQFASKTLRTEPISIFSGESNQAINLGLIQKDEQVVTGVVAADTNQNEIWDDAQSAGQNGVAVELLDQLGNVVLDTITRPDGFGRPGRFSVPLPTGSGTDEFSLRLTYAASFVGSQPTDEGPYMIELPLNEDSFFPVLIKEVPDGFDGGDAPAIYGSPLHKLSADLTIGLISDADTANADAERSDEFPADDQDQFDDEEGIFFANNGTVASTDETGELVIVVRNEEKQDRRLNGWIDFNINGQFEASEKIVVDYPVFPRNNPQAIPISFPIPAEATCGDTFARFRFGENDQPTGLDRMGEVEDMPFTIECVTDLEVTMAPESTPIGPNELSRWFVSMTNTGESPAENVLLNITIPTPFIYQGLVSLTNDPVACTDIDTARSTQTIQCQTEQLQSGQGITLSLSYFLPFDTEARSISSVATVNSDTRDSNPSNNLANQDIKVEKLWILQNPTYEAFTHVSLFPGIVENLDNREADFKQSTPIATVINVPISLTIGVDTNRLPILTVQSCIDNPEDPTCNSTNFVEGQVIQVDYGIERIFYQDELIFEPEEVEKVRLNRISDPNMARCGALGSCVGFDLFRVGRDEIRPYAWNAPDDYFYLGFFTSGGRVVRCPDEGYEDRCYIHYDAKPGIYELEGFATINLVFQDTRLGPDPVVIERELQFRSIIRVVAPFIEPER